MRKIPLGKGMYLNKFSKSEIRQMNRNLKELLRLAKVMMTVLARKTKTNPLGRTWGSRRFAGAVKLVGSNALKNVRRELRDKK